MGRTRTALNYGIYAQGYRADERFVTASNPEGYHQVLGSAGVLFLDQRLGLARMVDEARRWAQREGHVGFQLCKAYNGFASSRPVGLIMPARRKESQL